MDWQKVASDLAALARPVRIWIWVIVIIVITFYTMVTGGKPDNGGILSMIIVGIFADFGVNSFLRTNEKNTIVKTEGTTKVAETVTKDSTNTNIENINLSNEVVNMPPKDREIG